MAMAGKVLDVKGLKCPLPLLKAKKALKDVAPGETLEVLTTDPSSVIDFTVFCDTSGNELVEQGEADGTYRFLIRRDQD